MMNAAIRRLLLVWLALAVATLAIVPIGHAADPRPLGPMLVVALLGMAYVKAVLVLNDYLDLRHAPAWNAGLRAAIAVMLAIVGGLSVLASLR